MSCAAIIPSSSSFGPIPTSAATVALYCLLLVSGSECASQRPLSAWLASRLFQWSETEPPIVLSAPLKSSGSLATTIEGLASLALFLAVILAASADRFPSLPARQLPRLGAWCAMPASSSNAATYAFLVRSRMAGQRHQSSPSWRTMRNDLELTEPNSG